MTPLIILAEKFQEPQKKIKKQNKTKHIESTKSHEFLFFFDTRNMQWNLQKFYRACKNPDVVT